MKKLVGTGVALVTPFEENGAIDYKSLKKLLRHTANGGVDYFVVMGTTGESATLSRDEKNEVLRFVLENNPNKLPVMFGIGGNDTRHVLEDIEATDFTGVDAILSVCPYYNKPSQEGIVLHFTAIADASPVPVIIYNIPGRTGTNITADTMLRLAEHPKIAGVKEASGNLEQCMQIAHRKPKDFLLLSGDDMMTVPLYSIGARGVISVLANAFPGIFARMKKYAFEGQFDKASREQFRLLEINPLMYAEGNPTGVKQLLSEMGICAPYTRLPMAPASEGLRQKIAQAYAKSKRKG
ncbi:MAG: 4-hydroxy-tetrahydrodipicolinate synthase [Bacteroidota bacterium]|jgi:4-hydroxy-tetrahydrodipicolinate synthase|nr:MAG: 4-hydroxy-tetrahydrodipicolinate synthase [Bacteroidota bacterium]